MANVVAKLTCVTTLKDGTRVRVRTGMAFESSSAVVKEKPELFDMGSKPVEKATKAPGEVRKTSRAKKVESSDSE